MNHAARLLIVGHPAPTHVAGHFQQAAVELGLESEIADAGEAYEGRTWQRRVAWWLAGKRPLRLRDFGRKVESQLHSRPVTLLLATGLAPLDADVLRSCRRAGVITANFLTDDPWNPAHRATWFMDALAEYDIVFTPRRANVADIETIGGPAVEYLPFAFNPVVHYPDPPVTVDEHRRYDSELVFAGGADADRMSIVRTLLRAGFTPALYGGYWERDSTLAPFAKGMLDAPGLRRAVGGAAINLCLVRRANRDGHAMRSFEVPAMRGCMLLEDTVEHRSVFGADDHAAVYFHDDRSLVDGARRLLADPPFRETLARQAHAIVTTGGHTYRDRLARILATIAHETTSHRPGRTGTLSRV